MAFSYRPSGDSRPSENYPRLSSRRSSYPASLCSNESRRLSTIDRAKFLNSDPNSVLMNELDEMVGTFDLITDFGTLGEAENGTS